MSRPQDLERLLASGLQDREARGRVWVRTPEANLVAAVRKRASEVLSGEPRPPPESSADAAVEVFVRMPAETEVLAVQESLRPGAPWLMLKVPRRQERALSRRLLPFFDVERADAGVVRVRRRRGRDLSPHFEALAPEYWAELPPHIQDAYLRRKLAFLTAHLPSIPRPRGLDLGSGLGQFVRGLGQAGAEVVGLDPSRSSLDLAREQGAQRYVLGDSIRLPFRAASFDFAYAVNMLHHLKRGEQERALREIHRVLRPGAPLFVLEINVRNPLFRWYMRHVFPRTRRIDRGDEEFIDPRRLPLVPQFQVERVEYATFAPDFLPTWALRVARPLERVLEATPVRAWAIHYFAVLRSRRAYARHPTAAGPVSPRPRTST